MVSIDQIRKKYPELIDLTDEQILDLIKDLELLAHLAIDAYEKTFDTRAQDSAIRE